MKKYIKHIGSDAPASFVVFLVAVPLCLGIAVASKTDPFSGIIAGIIGGIVVGFFSGSALSVTGPAAGLTGVVATAITKVPAMEAFFLAVVIAGVLQMIMGFLKLGIIGDYVPNCVIKGMLAAIGITLILNQFTHLVGYDKNVGGEEQFIQVSGENTFSALVHSLNHLTPVAVLIGVISLFILIFYETKWAKSKKLFQILSGPLVVVVVGIVLNLSLKNLPEVYLLDTEHLVRIPVAQSTSEFLGLIKFPGWSYINNSDVWVTAFIIALVASLETLLSIEAIDKLDPLNRISPSNRELKAQGIGNVISGILGGLPVTSVIVRSSANVNAGAKTKVSAILHGLLILIFAVFFPKVLNLIPLSCLAAILIITGYKLAKPSLLKEYFHKGIDQLVPFVVTIIAILFTNLLLGVIIGIVVGLYFVIRSNFQTSVFMVNDKDYYLIRLRKDVSFFSKPILKSQLETIPENAFVLIDISRADFIDKDVMETIYEFTHHAALKNIRFEIKKREIQKSS